MPSLIYAGFNYSTDHGFFPAANEFISDRSVVWDWLQTHAALLVDWLLTHAALLVEWLKQPHVLAVIAAWWISFCVILILISCVGFNAAGIGAGTLAAAFQSWAYGGFTPAGGVFATLTSLAMLGWLLPVEVCVSAVVATIVALIVWAGGAGT